MIVLDRTVPTILVSDLHGRMEYLLSVLAFEPEDGTAAIDLLAAARLQVVCLGDGLHAEGRAVERWRTGLEEYLGGFERHEPWTRRCAKGSGRWRW